MDFDKTVTVIVSMEDVAKVITTDGVGVAVVAAEVVAATVTIDILVAHQSRHLLHLS